MKGYSVDFNKDESAFARLEGVNASYKDLAAVCDNIRRREVSWAIDFLEKAAKGETPVYYRKYKKKLAHRKELGGKPGRYPKKAAKIVLKVLKSAVANGLQKGLGEAYRIMHASATKKRIYPRLAPKGGQMRSYLETSRVEIVLTPLKEDGKKEKESKEKKSREKEKKVESKKEVNKKEIKKEVKEENKKAEVKKEEVKQVNVKAGAEPESSKSKS